MNKYGVRGVYFPISRLHLERFIAVSSSVLAPWPYLPEDLRNPNDGMCDDEEERDLTKTADLSIWAKSEVRPVLFDFLCEGTYADWYYASAILVPANKLSEAVLADLRELYSMPSGWTHESIGATVALAETLGFCGIQGGEGWSWLVMFSSHHEEKALRFERDLAAAGSDVATTIVIDDKLYLRPYGTWW